MAHQRHTTINISSATRLDQLTIEERNLFDLLCLVVDIKYRQRYGKPIEWDRGRGYNVATQRGKVLADQLPPVDNGLQGNSQREVPGNEPE
jgi:hypothetical protein